MCKLADSGKSIIMISSEMPELIGMSQRIYVMGYGQITAELTKDQFSQELILEKSALGKADSSNE